MLIVSLTSTLSRCDVTVLAHRTAFRYELEILLHVFDIATWYFEVLLRAWAKIESIATTDLHVFMFVDLEDMNRTAGK
jgi:hypothetical protein